MKYYGFDDVRVIPIASTVNSRDEVDLTTDFKYFKLKIPIICSPMKGIVTSKLVSKLSDLGGIGILHRFYDNQDDRIKDIKSLNGKNFGIAVGINWRYEDMNLINIAIDNGVKIICIDVANGYLESIKNSVTNLSNYLINYAVKTMAGNVITWSGANDLYNSGADIIRLGISTGQLCITGDVTGVSMPAISMLEGCRNIPAIKVMDGGIRNSGDIVKSLIAGADLVLIGSLFGRTFDSDHKGTISGMASKAHQEEYYHTTKSIEGITRKMDKDIDTDDLINELSWGIKSACTYLDSRSIKELKTNGRFIYLD
jgi:IMP dehydrogenase